MQEEKRKRKRKRRRKRRWMKKRGAGWALNWFFLFDILEKSQVATDLSGKLGDIWRLEFRDGHMASRQ